MNHIKQLPMKNRIFFTVICLLCLSVPANAQYDTLQNYPYLYTRSWQNIGVYHDGELCSVYDYVQWPMGMHTPQWETLQIVEVAVHEHTFEPLKVTGIASGNTLAPIQSRVDYTLYGFDMEIISEIEASGFGCPWEWDSNYHLFVVPGKNDCCRGAANMYDQYTQMPLKFCFFDNPIIIDSGDYYIGWRLYFPYQILGDVPYIIEEHNPPYHIDSCPIRLFDKENKVWLDDTLERERPELFLIIDPDYHGVSSVPEIETPNPTIEIYPNPATEQVEVTSSLPMARIVATDALGHRLLDRPATGLKTTLDVSRWPAGAYLLQVHTATGIASRKLLVQ